jgi:hypothetical protein
MSTKAVGVIIKLLAEYSDMLDKQRDVGCGSVIGAMLHARDGHSLYWCETPDEQKQMQDMCLIQLDNRLNNTKRELEVHLRAYECAKAAEMLRLQYEMHVCRILNKKFEAEQTELAWKLADGSKDG